MARPAHSIADLSDRAQPGARIAVRVTPRGGRDAISVDTDGTVRVRVSAAPTDGRANAAVQDLLARAMRVPKTRLLLIAGATSRDKVFQLAEVAR